MDWISLDKRGIYSYLQSCEISPEPNTKSTSTSESSRNGTTPREEDRLQCSVYLCCFCCLLPSIFLRFNDIWN